MAEIACILDMKVVEVELDPGETVVAEAGAMNSMEDGIRFEAGMGDGSPTTSGFMGKLLKVALTCLVFSDCPSLENGLSFCGHAA